MIIIKMIIEIKIKGTKRKLMLYSKMFSFYKYI
jgi:hypothetical protein